ncbi:MAG: hypothetical protein QXN05_02730 [Acidilobaceae archaeon]
MKPEVRILLSRCSEDICASIVLRGVSFDALVLAFSCAELCERLRKEGYVGELRYALGDCTCGVLPPPALVKTASFYETFLAKLIGLAEKMRRARATQPYR